MLQRRHASSRSPRPSSIGLWPLAAASRQGTDLLEAKGGPQSGPGGTSRASLVHAGSPQSPCPLRTSPPTRPQHSSSLRLRQRGGHPGRWRRQLRVRARSRVLISYMCLDLPTTNLKLISYLQLSVMKDTHIHVEASLVVSYRGAGVTAAVYIKHSRQDAGCRDFLL